MAWLALRSNVLVVAVAAASVLLGCPPTTGTVSGTVVDGFELPVSGARVHIDGRTRSTSPDGRFSLLEVPPVFDAAMTSSGGRHGIRFDQVERRIARFRIPADEHPAARTGTVQIRLPRPLESRERALVWPIEADPTTSILAYEAAPPTEDGVVTLRVDWAESVAPFGVWVHVLHYTVGDDERPVSYDGAFWGEVPMTPNGEAAIDAERWAVGTAPLAIEHVVPPGHTALETTVAVRLGAPRLPPAVLARAEGAQSVTVPVPIDPFIALDTTLRTRAPDGAISEIVRRFRPEPSAADGIARVVLEAPASRPAPRLEGAELDTEATVEIDAPPSEGFTRLVLRPAADDETLPTFTRVTRATRVRVAPELEQLGLTVPRGVPYVLEVERTTYPFDALFERWVPAPETVETTRSAPHTVTFVR